MQGREKPKGSSDGISFDYYFLVNIQGNLGLGKISVIFLITLSHFVYAFIVIAQFPVSDLHYVYIRGPVHEFVKYC